MCASNYYFFFSDGRPGCGSSSESFSGAEPNIWSFRRAARDDWEAVGAKGPSLSLTKCGKYFNITGNLREYLLFLSISDIYKLARIFENSLKKLVSSFLFFFLFLFVYCVGSISTTININNKINSPRRESMGRLEQRRSPTQLPFNNKLQSWVPKRLQNRWKRRST